MPHSVAEGEKIKKRKKKSRQAPGGKPIGDPVGGRDAPIKHLGHAPNCPKMTLTSTMYPLYVVTVFPSPKVQSILLHDQLLSKSTCRCILEK